jgi:hypothetical protein
VSSCDYIEFKETLEIFFVNKLTLSIFIEGKTSFMRTLFTIFFLICCSAFSNAQNKSANAIKTPRIEKIINSQWTFNYFPDEKADQGYESPDFDDSEWPAVNIPHTWMTYETTGDIHPFIKNASEEDNPYWWTGWGWYRKHLSIINTLVTIKEVMDHLILTLPVLLMKVKIISLPLLSIISRMISSEFRPWQQTILMFMVVFTVM